MSCYITPPSDTLDPKDRGKRLAKCYALILSWPLPINNSADPDDLGQDAGSAKDITSTELEDARQ